MNFDFGASRCAVYLRAAAIFLAQLAGLFFEKNWGLVVAAVAAWYLFQVVIPSEAPQFFSLVITEDGRTAIGQRVFGVPCAR